MSGAGKCGRYTFEVPGGRAESDAFYRTDPSAKEIAVRIFRFEAALYAHDPDRFGASIHRHIEWSGMTLGEAARAALPMADEVLDGGRDGGDPEAFGAWVERWFIGVPGGLDREEARRIVAEGRRAREARSETKGAA